MLVETWGRRSFELEGLSDLAWQDFFHIFVLRKHANNTSQVRQRNSFSLFIPQDSAIFYFKIFLAILIVQLQIMHA